MQYRRWMILLLIGGCGTKSGLSSPAGERDNTTQTDGGVKPGTLADAADDAQQRPFDAADAQSDADAAQPEPHDSGSRVDCRTAPEQIYFLLLRGTLFSDLHGDVYGLDPESERTRPLGTLACPAPEGSYPYSMAVGSNGTMWVYYWYDRVYKVDLADLSCVATEYVTALHADSELPFVFSMTGAGSDDGGDRLFAALDNPQFSEAPCTFGSLAPLVPAAERRGQLCPSVTDYVALAGTEDGRLFGLHADRMFEVDPTDGSALSERRLPRSQRSWPNAWTFWAEDAYLFGDYGFAPEPVEVVHLSEDGSMRLVGTLAPKPGEVILALGAGRSPCLPAE